MNGLIGGVVPMLILLAFGGGIMWAGRFCKTGLAQFFVGLVLGIGILFALVGVAFAGCLVIVGASSVHR
jgi:hypothetical protein